MNGNLRFNFLRIVELTKQSIGHIDQRKDRSISLILHFQIKIIYACWQASKHLCCLSSSPTSAHMTHIWHKSYRHHRTTLWSSDPISATLSFLTLLEEIQVRSVVSLVISNRMAPQCKCNCYQNHHHHHHHHNHKQTVGRWRRNRVSFASDNYHY